MKTCLVLLNLKITNFKVQIWSIRNVGASEAEKFPNVEALHIQRDMNQIRENRKLKIRIEDNF